MFTKLSIKKKLFLLCSCLLMFSFIGGFISFSGLLGLDRNLTEITTGAIPETLLIDQMYLEFSKTRIALRTIGLEGISKEESEKAIQEVFAHIEAYENYQAEYEKKLTNENQKNIFLDVKQKWNALREIGTTAIDLYKDHSPESKQRMIEIFLVDCPMAANNYNNSVNKLLTYQKNVIEHLTKTSLASSKNDRSQQSLIIVLSIIFGSIVGYFFIKNVNGLLEKISSNIILKSQDLDKIASEISSVSTSLERNMSQQTISLQQTATALEQTSVNVLSNAENAKKSLQASDYSLDSANKTQLAMNEVTSSMKEIAQSIKEIEKAIDSSNREITAVVHIIDEISNKTKIINEIVFQTKILSFNASVEAARAGDHGRGFSVVAEEIGNLAAKSGESAKEITVLLETSVQKVEQTIEASQKSIARYVMASVGKVDIGNRVILDCENNLKTILEQMENLHHIIGDITQSTDEQSLSIREINQAMTVIDGLNSNNNNNSKQTFQTAKKLEKQLNDFSEIADELKLAIRGA